MKIGISALHVRPGKSGSHEPYLVNLVNALYKLDTPHQFSIFVTPGNKHLFNDVIGKFKLIEYPKIVNKVLPRIFFEQFILPFDAKKRGIDVLHYAGTTASFFIRGSDVVTVHHDSVTARKSMSIIKNLYFDFVLRFNKKAGGVIAPTKIYADKLIKNFGYKAHQMFPVHHGVSSLFRNISKTDIKKTHGKFNINPNSILTVTSTYPHKNIANLLRAFELLITKHHKQYQLVMVGSINIEILDNLICEIANNANQMRSLIKVIPFMPHDQLPPIYAASKIFVFYSKIESFGMPLVEAMATKMPVIASDIPAHREVLGNGGVFISPEEPAKLAKTINNILDDVDYQIQLKNAAENRGKHFSWKQTAIQTVKVYEKSYSSKKVIKNFK